MTKKTRNHVDDLRGATELVVEAIRRVTEVVEEMHTCSTPELDPFGTVDLSRTA